MNPMNLIKELSSTMLDNMKQIREKFTKMDDKLNGLETFVKDFEPFDPSELEKSIHDVKESVNNYDDSELKESIEEIKKSIPKEYDDSGLQEQLNGIKTLLEKEITTIKKELDTPLKVEIPTAKQYDGEPTAKGQFVIFENGLYVNLMDDNASEPVKGNASYKQIIEPPKALQHKGLYDENIEYEFNDIVMFDNSSWIKTINPEQSLPSEGWKLLAKGIRGRKGEKGEPGDVTVVEPEYEEVIQELHDEITVLKATVKGLENDVAKN